MSRVLVVEDRERLLTSLLKGLREEGFEVRGAADGREGLEMARTEQVDAMVLDLMLPKRDGFDVLLTLRAGGFDRPVLILTAKDSIEDRVRGLDGGADDYLVKPFAFAELVARLRALSRRDSRVRQLVLRVDDLELSLVERRARRAGRELDLTRREFELLEFLMRNKDQELSRETIGREVWRENSEVLTNVIDVYINTLRKKVERPGSWQLIHTIRGVGYSMKEPG